MSSGGARPEGTDGQDFLHRQKVAKHYRESVTYKGRLRSILMCHALLAFPMFVRLFEDLLNVLGADVHWLDRLAMPDAALWEYWWLLGCAAVPLGMTAVKQNCEKRMLACYYTLFMGGVLPVCIGAGLELPTLLRYIGDPHNADTAHFMNKFPLCVMWFMFFIVCGQVHGFSMHFALKLLNMWRPMSVAEKVEMEKKAN